MLVLTLDTSTTTVETGVVEVRTDGGLRVCAERRADAVNRQGEVAAPLVRAALADAAVDAGELAAVVVGLGPGPFTGLRAGIVTAAALGDALSVPVYGVCSLDAIGLDAQAHIAATDANGSTDAVDVLVVTDARRRRLYWATYTGGVRRSGPELATAAELADRTDSATRVVGPGAGLYADAFARFDRDPDRRPTAAAMTTLALDRVVARDPSDELTPLYLRQPDAVPPGPPKQVTPR